jgi:hemerythrin
MMEDHKYNLMAQMVEEHRSLWRITNMYLKDAGDCEACKEFWSELAKDKEKHVNDLEKLIREHM